MYKVDWLRKGWIPQTRTYRTREAASAAYSTACGAEAILAARLSVLSAEGWVAVSRCFRSQTASKAA